MNKCINCRHMDDSWLAWLVEDLIYCQKHHKQVTTGGSCTDFQLPEIATKKVSFSGKKGGIIKKVSKEARKYFVGKVSERRKEIFV